MAKIKRDDFFKLRSNFVEEDDKDKDRQFKTAREVFEQNRKRILETSKNKKESNSAVTRGERRQSATIQESEPDKSIIDKGKDFLSSELEKRKTKLLGRSVSEAEPGDFTMDTTDSTLGNSVKRDRINTRIYDSIRGETRGSFVAGIGDVITGAGQVARWQGEDGLADQLIKKGGEFQVYAPLIPDKDVEELKELGWEDLSNPRLYTQFARQIPFTLGAMALAYGGVAAAGVAGVSGLSATILGLVGGAGLTTTMEAAFEAGQAYDESLSQGADIKTADKNAKKVFVRNAALLSFSNLAEAFIPILKTTEVDDVASATVLKRIFFRSSKAVSGKSTKLALGTTLEVGEEFLQSKISSGVTGREVGREELKQTLFFGGLGGLVFTAGGMVVESQSGRDVTADITKVGIAQAEQTKNEIQARIDTEVPEVREAITKKVLKGEAPFVAEKEVYKNLKGESKTKVESIIRETVVNKIVEEETINENAAAEFEASKAVSAIPQQSTIEEALATEQDVQQKNKKIQEDFLEGRITQSQRDKLITKNLTRSNAVAPSKTKTKSVAKPKLKEAGIPKSQLPIGTGKKKKSKAFTRITDRLTSESQLDVSFNQLNLVKNAEESASFVSEKPEDAVRVGLGLQDIPSNVQATEAAISIAASEQALEQGNHSLFAQLEGIRSRKQTRRGQEIVTERGRFDDNSPQSFMKELISRRLDAQGQGIFKRSIDDFGKRGSTKEVAIKNIGREASKLKKEILPNTKKEKIRLAQKFMNDLTC